MKKERLIQQEIWLNKKKGTMAGETSNREAGGIAKGGNEKREKRKCLDLR